MAQVLLDWVLTATCRQWSAHMHTKHDLQHFMRGWDIVLGAQVSLEAKASGRQLALDDKQGLLKAAASVWDAEASSKHNKQRSYYAKDVVDTVIGLGLQYEEEDISSGYAVDVSLPKLKVAIEADGPSHRSRNTGQLLGQTVMKQRHVHYAGWKLLTVAHDDWDELRGRQQKLDFLQTRIDLLK